MNLPLLRPKVSDLVFQLYGRPLHPELFDIVATRQVRHEDYQVTVRVTRSGHVITFENEDVLLTEVTADAETPLPEKRRLFHYRMRGEHSGTFTCAHGITYQMSFQVEPMTPEVFQHFHGELLRDGSKRGLLHHFHPHHRIELSPLSYITVEARPGCLFLSSFHTFPGEETVVKTQSLIEKK